MGSAMSFSQAEYEEAKTVAGSGGYEPIPAGEYVLMVVESELKNTQTGGEMLKTTHVVTEGQYKNRKMFINYNIKNRNPKAEAIGKRDLGELCRALGINGIRESSEELHNKEYKGRVKIQPGKGQYGPSNSITKYERLSNYSSTPEKESKEAPWERTETSSSNASTQKKAWEK